MRHHMSIFIPLADLNIPGESVKERQRKTPLTFKCNSSGYQSKMISMFLEINTHAHNWNGDILSYKAVAKFQIDLCVRT